MKPIKEFAIEIILVIVVIISISLLWENPPLLMIILFTLFAGTTYFWPQQNDITYYFVGFFLGPLVEIIAIHFGAWSYTVPSFFGIPLWLPFAWGYVSIMLMRIGNTLTMLKK